MPNIPGPSSTRPFGSVYADSHSDSPSLLLKAENVRWGEFSIVQAELNCLRDLLDNGRNWSYALDMAGSEVMLLTNRELVHSLDKTGKTIFTASFRPPAKEKIRVQYKFPPGIGDKWDMNGPLITVN